MWKNQLRNTHTLRVCVCCDLAGGDKNEGSPRGARVRSSVPRKRPLLFFFAKKKSLAQRARPQPVHAAA